MEESNLVEALPEGRKEDVNAHDLLDIPSTQIGSNVQELEKSDTDESDAYSSTSEGPYRMISFTLPAGGMIKASKATEKQVLTKIAANGFVMVSYGYTPSVPYGDTFFSKAQFVVTALNEKQSKVQISGTLCWNNKPPFVKGIITSEVKKGQSSAFKAYMEILGSFIRRKSRSRRLEFQLQSQDAGEERSSWLLKSLTLSRIVTLLLIVVLPLLIALLLFDESSHAMFTSLTHIVLQTTRNVFESSTSKEKEL